MYSGGVDRSSPSSWQVQQQHEYAAPTRQQQSQSGWFPLEDAALPQQPQVQRDMLYAPPVDPQDRWDAVYGRQMDRSAYAAPSPSAHGAYASDPQVHHEVSAGLQLPGYAWTNDTRITTAAVPAMTHAADPFDDQFTHPYATSPVYASDPPAPIVVHQHPYQYPQQQPFHSMPTARRKAKEISIGRWNADEHKWFLKGLDMFQGPAWGEIARLIGTRTSTQVRTHAQKFFTRLARMNKSLPYFEAQIQKERSRLLAQGGPNALVGSSSVTPTSTSGFNFALASLSPRKRVLGSSPHPNRRRSEDGGTPNMATSTHYSSSMLPSNSIEYAMPKIESYADDHAVVTDKSGRVPASYNYYHHADDSSSADIYKPKYDHHSNNLNSEATSPLLRKPRIFASTPVAPPPLQHSSSFEDVHLTPTYASASLPTAMHAKDAFDSSRHHFAAIDGSPVLASRDDLAYGMMHAGSNVAVDTGATVAAAADPWTQVSSPRQWMTPSSSSLHQDASAAVGNSSSGELLDANESLPSMTKLLYRGNAAVS
ncbi:Lhy protein, partial [Globisporangium splendens]